MDYVYIGDTDYMGQSLSAVYKCTPKLFNVFEAKAIIENTKKSHFNQFFTYYIKPIEET